MVVLLLLKYLRMKKINIVIADDNRFFCEALKDSIELDHEFNVKATFFSIKDLINYTNTNVLDLLILDMNFNGVSSLNYIDQIRLNKKNFKIILLTTLNNNLTKREATEKGIDQFVGKDSDLKNFKPIILQTITNNKFDQLKKNSSKIILGNTSFTKRKIEVLRALYKYSNKNEKELSKILYISESSLKSHKRELFEITNTNNTLELIRYGIKNGLILP